MVFILKKEKKEGGRMGEKKNWFRNRKEKERKKSMKKNEPNRNGTQIFFQQRIEKIKRTVVREIMMASFRFRNKEMESKSDKNKHF